MTGNNRRSRLRASAAGYSTLGLASLAPASPLDRAGPEQEVVTWFHAGSMQSLAVRKLATVGVEQGHRVRSGDRAEPLQRLLEQVLNRLLLPYLELLTDAVVGDHHLESGSFMFCGGLHNFLFCRHNPLLYCRLGFRLLS